MLFLRRMHIALFTAIIVAAGISLSAATVLLPVPTSGLRDFLFWSYLLPLITLFCWKISISIRPNENSTFPWLSIAGVYTATIAMLTIMFFLKNDQKISLATMRQSDKMISYFFAGLTCIIAAYKKIKDD